MKKIKKMFAACMATLIAGATLGSISALSSSAAILGDVNNDGKLDVSDVVTLNKFLAGEGVLSNYNVADTNAIERTKAYKYQSLASGFRGLF